MLLSSVVHKIPFLQTIKKSKPQGRRKIPQNNLSVKVKKKMRRKNKNIILFFISLHPPPPAGRRGRRELGVGNPTICYRDTIQIPIKKIISSHLIDKVKLIAVMLQDQHRKEILMVKVQ